LASIFSLHSAIADPQEVNPPRRAIKTADGRTRTARAFFGPTDFYSDERHAIVTSRTIPVLATLFN
jgi:hypothetical protein